MKKRSYRKKGPVKSKKQIVDGIIFKSGLEVHMYKLLKENSLFDKYEQEKFTLIDGFKFLNDSYERQSNGKGEFKNRNKSSIRKMTYTPDFTSDNYIIETKGRANESFPLRWKLFKNLMIKNNDTRPLYKPQTKAECVEVIKLILKNKT